MYPKFIKRVLDVVFSVIGLIGFLPVYLALTIIGYVLMDGKPFFTQERVSRLDRNDNPKTFNILKFRSIKNVDGTPKVTCYGRFLRATSLDETPQLINVLLGSMSIVGPRPVPQNELVDCDKKLVHERLTVRAGITGLAQVSGRNNLDRIQKYEYDCIYAQDVCFRKDVKIFFYTILKVLLREGIYQKQNKNKDKNSEREVNSLLVAIKK